MRLILFKLTLIILSTSHFDCIYIIKSTVAFQHILIYQLFAFLFVPLLGVDSDFASSLPFDFLSLSPAV